MNLGVLKNLLAVQTVSFHEQAMVDWLVDYVTHNIPGATVTVDKARNVYVSKGSAQFSPCVAAHIDSVHAPKEVRIIEDKGCMIGYGPDGKRTGIGGDDKAGVFVCLQLLHRFEHIRAIFFATEECGCVGARQVDPTFIDGLAYLMEFDCPSRNMMSYTSSQVRLFENDGDFIKAALPALKKHGTTLWQHHPYTDIMAIRQKFPISCLNLSCGYYNWHQRDEFVVINDVALAIEQGAALVGALEYVRYACPVDLRKDVSETLIPITGLHVPNPFECPPHPQPSCV